MSAKTNITSLAPARSAEFIFTGPEVLSARPAKRTVPVQPLALRSNGGR
jgi:hypothetical protein